MANGPGYDAADVFLQARACLNDQANETYSDASLQTWLQMAWEDLELELIANDAPMGMSKAILSVPAGTLAIFFSTTPALPTDLWMPIALLESEPGKNVWQPMRQKLFEKPVLTSERSDGLIYWSWHEDTIYFDGAKQDRDVLLYYFKALAEVTTASTDLGRFIPLSRGFLSRKVAAFAYALQKKDLETAQIMQDEAVNFKDRIVSIIVKQNQNMPVRRRAYVAGRFARRRLRMG